MYAETQDFMELHTDLELYIDVYSLETDKSIEILILRAELLGIDLEKLKSWKSDLYLDVKLYVFY